MDHWKIFFTAGWSEGTGSFSGGVKRRRVKRMPIKIDYAARDVGVSGKSHCYSMGVEFLLDLNVPSREEKWTGG